MILYEAKCVKGVVTLIDGINSTVVPDCKILGTGKAATSTGIIIADQDRFWYLPLVTVNVESIVAELISITQNLSDTVKALSKSGTLIDSASTAAGIAAFVPSVVTGEVIATEAKAISPKVDKIAQELKILQENIV